ncbi:alpha/beta fold hydrolase [Streptomyces sp. F001]|uniref:alpha/beta fold hydrolase n=1 Tax=Streptomyces sp. F001 TaxID=1510026 RepID=UPI0023EA5332|nr:alpha/beta fold hydrolase [Streptomyces sp. F001]
MIPKGRAPSGGWPVVAWGHGTSGVGPDCAPSRYPNLYPSASDEYGDMVARLLRDGYAVVGTDYPGLGFPGQLHNYMQLYTLARSVIDSVKAARKVSPQLGRQWFAVGHSEGGQAVLGVDELAARRAPDLEFLGTVPLAPSSYQAEFADDMSSPPPPDGPATAGAVGYLAYMAVGAKKYAPKSIRYTDLVSPEVMAQMPTAERLCYPQLVYHLATLTQRLQHLGNPEWARNHTLYQWFKDIHPARQRSAAPILLLQGGADTDVTPGATNRLDGDLCALGDVVEYHTYPKADHNTLLDAAYPDIAAWLDTRLKGRPATQTCQPVTGTEPDGSGQSAPRK